MTEAEVRKVFGHGSAKDVSKRSGRSFVPIAPALQGDLHATVAKTYQVADQSNF